MMRGQYPGGTSSREANGSMVPCRSPCALRSRVICFCNAALTRVNSGRATLVVSETRARCPTNCMVQLLLELDVAHRMDFPRSLWLHTGRPHGGGNVVDIEEQGARHRDLNRRIVFVVTRCRQPVAHACEKPLGMISGIPEPGEELRTG